MGILTSKCRKTITHDEIQRLANDSNASIGYFYDARIDQFVQSPSLVMSTINKQQRIKSSPIVNRHLCNETNHNDIINMDKQLLFSVFFELVQANGICEFVKAKFVTNTYTRIFTYYYPQYETTMKNVKSFIDSSASRQHMTTVNATHFVTSIKYGIHVCVVLQLLPEYEKVNDMELEEVINQLLSNKLNVGHASSDLLNRLTVTQVFSNIPDITEKSSLSEICNKIIEYVSNDSLSVPPIEYTMRSIITADSLNDSINKCQYFSLDQECTNQLYSMVNELIPLYNTYTLLKSQKIDKTFPQLSKIHDKIQKKNKQIDKCFRETIQTHGRWIRDARSGKVEENSSLIQQYEQLMEEMKHFEADVYDLNEKNKLVEQLKKANMRYLTVDEYVTDTSTEEEIIQQLVKRHNNEIIYCFDSKLRDTQPVKWDDLFQSMKHESRNNKSLKIILADFSYTRCHLTKLGKVTSGCGIDKSKAEKVAKLKPSSLSTSTGRIPEESRKYTSSSQISLSNKKNLNANEPKDRNRKPTSCNNVVAQKLENQNRSQPSDSRYINVLCIGETGIGKSTFVNALANYLKFETYERAYTGQPLVLIPVSFLMTVGHDFKEQIVRFGENDPNEDHNNIGQSVTQHCRSYVLPVGTQTLLRIIDTPGMGDTRGLEQDDCNMQHILSFINNLDHLNAICILLKPNEAKLTLFFRTYFDRLISFLGEKASQHIIFCFTNTRSTFYAPGNTAPLVKQFLQSNSINGIRFEKSNTFCFDNEAFRYLVACRNGIQFDVWEHEEYKRSWETSVKESHRFLDYVCNSRPPLSCDDWRSLEHVQYKINQLIRPIVETMRNTMRNMIISKENLSKSFIILKSSVAPMNSRTCRNCRRTRVIINNFGIFCDQKLSKEFKQCRCNPSKYSELDYILEYKSIIPKTNISFTEMKKKYDNFKETIFVFSHFFRQMTDIQKRNDPILRILEEAIMEEEELADLFEDQRVSNISLCNGLKELRTQYEHLWIKQSSENRFRTIESLYQQIYDISKDADMCDQLGAINETQRIRMKQLEKELNIS